MKHLRSMIPIKLPASFTMQAGHCATHGEAQALVRQGHAWACPTCHETQVAAQVRARWIEQRKADLLYDANIPQKYAGLHFIANTPAQRQTRNLVTSFLDAIADGKQWAALILCGEAGTGKTRLACELAQHCASDLLRSVRYVTANEMIGQIQASYNTEGKSEAAEIARLVDYELLIIDEIDAKVGSDNAQRLLTEVINRRYNADKPVIIISNQQFDRLVHFVGDRVHDRLHENAFICVFQWPSFRRRQKPHILRAIA